MANINARSVRIFTGIINRRLLANREFLKVATFFAFIVLSGDIGPRPVVPRDGRRGVLYGKCRRHEGHGGTTLGSQLDFGRRLSVSLPCWEGDDSRTPGVHLGTTFCQRSIVVSVLNRLRRRTSDFFMATDVFFRGLFGRFFDQYLY